MNRDLPRGRRTLRATIGALAAALALVAVAPATAALKHYDGTVLGTNQGAQTFRIDTQSGKVKFKVNGRTEFERVPGGFAGLTRGLAIEVDAKEGANGLVARQVETRGGSGDNDDNGADDPLGDDNGHDGPNHP